MRNLFCFLLTLGVLSAHAQSAPSFSAPKNAVSQLEDLKELTKSVAVTKPSKSKLQAEARPDINRMLVLAADDFLRITNEKPSKEAYLQCLDRDLARVAPLATDAQDRKDVAQYFQELMEIVGLESSEGRLSAFAGIPDTKQ